MTNLELGVWASMHMQCVYVSNRCAWSHLTTTNSRKRWEHMIKDTTVKVSGNTCLCGHSLSPLGCTCISLSHPVSRYMDDVMRWMSTNKWVGLSFIVQHVFRTHSEYSCTSRQEYSKNLIQTITVDMHWNLSTANTDTWTNAGAQPNCCTYICIYMYIYMRL